MTEAVVKATYSDYRRVKGRKVLQLIFEVPIEKAPEVHDTFGEPAPDGSTWVAIARLQEPSKQQAEKPKRNWNDMPRSQQAGIACEEADFRKFLEYRGWRFIGEEETATAVRALCNVRTRADLDKDAACAKNWDKLYSDYQFWKRGAAA